MALMALPQDRQQTEALLLGISPPVAVRAGGIKRERVNIWGDEIDPVLPVEAGREDAGGSVLGRHDFWNGNE